MALQPHICPAQVHASVRRTAQGHRHAGHATHELRLVRSLGTWPIAHHALACAVSGTSLCMAAEMDSLANMA